MFDGYRHCSRARRLDRGATQQAWPSFASKDISITATGAAGSSKAGTNPIENIEQGLQIPRTNSNWPVGFGHSYRSSVMCKGTSPICRSG